MEAGAGDSTRCARQDGKFYLLPGLHEKLWQDYSLAVRTDILEQAQPAEPETWDELHDRAQGDEDGVPRRRTRSPTGSASRARQRLLNIAGAAYGTVAGWGLPARDLGLRRAKKEFVFTGATDAVQAAAGVPQQAGDRGAARPGELHPDRRRRLAEARQRQVVRDQQQRADPRQRLPHGHAKIPGKATAVGKIPLPVGPAGDINPARRLENGIMISKKAREEQELRRA